MPETCRYQRYDTPGVLPAERFDYWRTWYSEAVDSPMRLEPVGPLTGDFDSAAEVLAVGDVAVIETRCGPARGMWNRAGLEATDLLRLDIFYRAPRVTGFWHGREVTAPSGTVVLFGRTGGWWRAPHGLRTIQVNVPRSRLPVEESVIERITAGHLPPDSVIVQTMARPMLLGMIGRLADLSGVVTLEFSTTWLSILTWLLRSLEGYSNCTDPEIRPAKWIRAVRFIEAQLTDHRLSPDSVAAALGMSRRSLYELFAAHDETVATMIRRKRLERAHRLLLEPAHRDRPIAEIAAEAGFASAAHFSRAFRAEYGETPRGTRSRTPRL